MREQHIPDGWATVEYPFQRSIISQLSDGRTFAVEQQLASVPAREDESAAADETIVLAERER